jgi:hypothetical protein
MNIHCYTVFKILPIGYVLIVQSKLKWVTILNYSFNVTLCNKVYIYFEYVHYCIRYVIF